MVDSPWGALGAVCIRAGSSPQVPRAMRCRKARANAPHRAKMGGQNTTKGKPSRRSRLWAMARAPRRSISKATKKPARMKNTGMRNAWMNAISKSAVGVVWLSRQGRGEGPAM